MCASLVYIVFKTIDRQLIPLGLAKGEFWHWLQGEAKMEKSWGRLGLHGKTDKLPPSAGANSSLTSEITRNELCIINFSGRNGTASTAWRASERSVSVCAAPRGALERKRPLAKREGRAGRSAAAACLRPERAQCGAQSGILGEKMDTQ